jgi:hypothetical protein
MSLGRFDICILLAHSAPDLHLKTHFAHYQPFAQKTFSIYLIPSNLELLKYLEAPF